MTVYYTYLWLREDGTPYYVGKGSGNRAYRKGSPKGRVLVQEFPSEEDAFMAERLLITFYGRKDLSEGCLINLTDGGENPPRTKKGTGLGRTPWNKGKRCPQIAANMVGNTNGTGGKGKVVSVEQRQLISRTLKDKGIRPTIEACRAGGKARQAGSHA